MILVNIIGKILDVRRKFKGFDLAFEDFGFLGVYHPTVHKKSGSISRQGTNTVKGIFFPIFLAHFEFFPKSGV